VADQLARKGEQVCYEAFKIKYNVPAKTCTYTPDFVLLRNGIIVETKGRFVTADRQKHKHIKAQYPNLVIRFVFSNPNQRISKKSQTTYAMWCDQYGFEYAAKLIPDAWLKESLTPSQVEATKSVLGWSGPPGPKTPTTTKRKG
jgi:hypothetical protein